MSDQSESQHEQNDDQKKQYKGLTPGQPPSTNDSIQQQDKLVSPNNQSQNQDDKSGKTSPSNQVKNEKGQGVDNSENVAAGTAKNEQKQEEGDDDDEYETIPNKGKSSKSKPITDYVEIPQSVRNNAYHDPEEGRNDEEGEDVQNTVSQIMQKKIYEQQQVHSESDTEQEKNESGLQDNVLNTRPQTNRSNPKAALNSNKNAVLRMEDCNSEESIQKRIKNVEKLRASLEQPMDQIQLEAFLRAHKVFSDAILDFKQLCQSEFLRIKRFKSGFYFGETQNGSRSGSGVMFYFTGRVYEGEWLNDAKFGLGYELYPNGSCYQGAFVNGKPEGYGWYVWHNGETYDGYWVNGMKHGDGEWKGVKGDSYVGEWKFGKADGKGIHKWINGDVYEGEFKCLLKHGKGSEKFQNGDSYVGYYANGRPEGEGEYLWRDGAYYKGFFKNGLRHGEGLWKKNRTMKVSDSYQGEYINDKRCGYGVFTWASGNEYKGEYFEDLRHGYGEMYWKDSSYYKGQWEKGIQSGEGELYIVGDGVKKGFFVNNVFKQFVGDGAQMKGLGPQGNSSQYRSFKTISDGNSTPRGIYQGSSSQRRQFQPNSSILSEESRNANGEDSRNHHGQQSEEGYQYGNSNTHPVGDFNTKLPKIKGSHGNGNDRNSDDEDNDDESNENGNKSHNHTMKSARSMSVQSKMVEARGTQTIEKNNKATSTDRNDNPSWRNQGKTTKLPQISNSTTNRNGKNYMTSPDGISGKKKRLSSKKKREILMQPHEIILWKGMRAKLGIKPRELRDYTDPKTVEIIRNYLHPPIWKPAGLAPVQKSPSQSRSPSPNHFLHKQNSVYSKTSRIY